MGWLLGLILFIFAIIILIPMSFYYPSAIVNIVFWITIVLSVIGGIKIANQKDNEER